MTPKESFISVWKTFQQMQYMESCQLIKAIEYVEDLALKNLNINPLRKDVEAGKVKKKK